MGFVFHWVHGRCDACCTDGAVCVEVTARPPSTQRLRHASQACVQHVCHWPVLLPKPHVLFFFERLVTPQQLLSIQPLRTPLHSAQGLTDTQNDIYITSHHITSHHITSHHITSQTKETSAARHQDQTLFPVQQMMTLNNKALCCMLC